MKKTIALLSLFCLLQISVSAQVISGVVMEMKNGKHEPLAGATILLINTNQYILSGDKGDFSIPLGSVSDYRLIVSMLGFQTDTFAFVMDKPLMLHLQSIKQLKTAEVVYEKSGTMISMNPIKTEVISDKELRKAACCNLGESFETNATVDVTYKDALTGSKELQVLGLSGSYIQLLTENAPLISGLGITYGLNGIPGTQIDAINIVKGPGSVIFGPEAISGMINVDLKDPEKAPMIFVNGYADENLRKEINVDLAKKFSPELSTFLSIHADDFRYKVDENGDTFLDMPMVTNFNILSKWKYNNRRGLMSQNSIKFLTEERMSGQSTFDYSRNSADLTSWGQKINTNRVEFYGRTGYVIPNKTYQSFGLQYSLVSHIQQGFYGMRKYDGEQLSGNLRLIYNRELGKKNSMNIGFSYRLENIDEKFDVMNLDRVENIPGVFLEDTYKPNARLTFIAGLRADKFVNKVYWSPRANVKYSFSEHTDVRASVGMGVRNPHLFAENPALLVSSKPINILNKLVPEQAINFGINLTQEFHLAYRNGSIGVDYYRTDFLSRMRVDMDQDPLAFTIYNQTNGSTSTTFQTDFMYKILKTVELKLAYKYLEVESETSLGKLQDPFIAKHRFISSLYYESFNKKWKSNFTINWVGQKRLPAVHSHFNAEDYPKYSPAYQTVNIQVTRKLKNFEIYTGSENLFDFKQLTHLMGSDDPYGPYFDASYIWGPMDGRRIYVGFRYQFTAKK